MSERLAMNQTKIHSSSVPLFLTFFLSSYSVLVLLETLTNCKSAEITFLFSLRRRRDLATYTSVYETHFWHAVSHTVYVFLYYILALQSRSLPLHCEMSMGSWKSKFCTCMTLCPEWCSYWHSSACAHFNIYDTEM